MFKISLGLLAVFMSLSAYCQKAKRLAYDLPLEELTTIHLPVKGEVYNILPTFEMSLEDLSILPLVKSLAEKHTIDFNYDLALNDLLELELDHANSTVQPGFSMTLDGLSQLIVKEEYLISERIAIPYDLSIECLTKLSIVN